SSAMESRIILDQMGAEKLGGSGDMLYAPIGIGKPTRIQGAFVTDEEREEIVGFIKQNGEAEYNEEILYSIEQAAEKGTSGGKAESAGESEKSEYDELLPQAVDVIFETKQASVSMLQRRLKLGYSRAARIVDQMEELGVVGPFEGSKPRQILLTREQWQEMQTIHGTAPTETLTEPPSFADFQDAPVEEWEDA
ncbi:MAG: DNA translocase FtsK, partial [Oscillospiraceae bacterium]|nr:DNA translocase FtsK [Oscillospiraceae bacterium]